MFENHGMKNWKRAWDEILKLKISDQFSKKCIVDKTQYGLCHTPYAPHWSEMFVLKYGQKYISWLEYQEFSEKKNSTYLDQLALADLVFQIL